ncbi:unnamed protein product [Rhodiola kirilowii]
MLGSNTSYGSDKTLYIFVQDNSSADPMGISETTSDRVMTSSTHARDRYNSTTSLGNERRAIE